jgi:two-component system NtrC family response regulator
MADEKRKLLVVEDDPGLQRQYRWNFGDYEVFLDRAEALKVLRAQEPKVMTLDLGLPPDPDGTSEGFAVLEEVLRLSPNTKVIIASGHAARESALKAIAMGAYDFYQKPIDAEALGLIVQRAFHVQSLEEENRRLQSQKEHSPLTGVITGAPEMFKICEMIERVAPTNVSVMLLGASGTGKELLARAIHELSSRHAKPFVAINCAAIPENLLESELFGHEKGSFTGAIKQTLGKIEMADTGTLFLDEIGDLPFPLQVKLLRFLQERVIERIGGRKEIPVDVRIVCATHQNLEQLIVDNRFREDLFYRLTEISVDIPPLFDRKGDPTLLAFNFLNKFNKEHDRAVKGFTPDALAALAAHTWPGNVRELENRLKRAVIMAEGTLITGVDLGLGGGAAPATILNLKQVREEADRKALQTALATAENNISQAAKLLGVSRPTLYDLLKQYNMTI